MESFWHSLKVEETHGQDFAAGAEARHCVFGYIEDWYNTTRMHSILNDKSPIQFERECNAKPAEAANDDLPKFQATAANPLGCIKERLKPSMKIGQDQHSWIPT